MVITPCADNDKTLAHTGGIMEITHQKIAVLNIVAGFLI